MLDSCHDGAPATAEEQIANLNRRASETRAAMLRKRIDCAMRNPPHVCEGLWENLVSMGHNEKSVMEKTDTFRSFQAAAIEQRKKRKIEEDMAVGGPQEYDDETMAGIPWDNIPKKLSMLSDILVTSLRDKLLSSLETTLSSSDLRSMKGPDAASKSGLLRIFEFTTGPSPDTELHTRPAFSCYNRLAEIAKKHALSRGRRALFLTRPPDWGSSGLFELRGCSKDNPKVVEDAHRFADNVCNIDVACLLAHGQLSDLAIFCNWSETRASIHNAKSPSGTGMLLSPYFPKQHEVISVPDGEAKSAPMESPAKLLKSIAKATLVSTSLGVKVQPKTEDEAPAEETNSARLAGGPQLSEGRAWHLGWRLHLECAAGRGHGAQLIAGACSTTMLLGGHRAL